MDYIINPMWFYWLQIIDSLRTVCVLFAVFSSIACTIIWCIACYELSYSNPEDEDYRRYKRIAVILTPVTVFFILCIIFLPSKNTMIEMQIARYATRQNVEFGIDAIKSATDYVIQAIQQLK